MFFPNGGGLNTMRLNFSNSTPVKKKPAFSDGQAFDNQFRYRIIIGVCLMNLHTKTSSMV